MRLGRTAHPARELAFACMFITLGIAPRDGRAADPQPYRTSLAKTGDASLDAALSGSSGLVGLQKTNAVGPFALAGRIRADYDRLRTALESFGYYDGTVSIT